MKRREFIETSSLGAAGLAGLYAQACTSAREETARAERPNIVLLVADDAGWNDVGWHGSEISTPNLDRMVRDGVELDSFYVYPTCSPTRASFLTGRPPSRFGILGPIAMRSTLALPKNTPTLAELLRRSGYDTAIVGKWHLGLTPGVGPNEYGFTHSYGYLHGQIDQLTHIYKNGDRSWHRNGKFVEEEGHATDLIAREAIRFITGERDTSKPLFLYVPFSVPHYPLQEDETYISLYRESIENESRRVFAASMTHMDDVVGQILTALGKAGASQNTLVVFLSDNGGQESWTPTFEYDGKFRANDRLGDNTPLRGWKGELYEGGIRVPAVFYQPTTLQPRKVTEPVIVWDLFPTLVHVAGADLSAVPSVEGANIWPLVRSGITQRERVFYWRTGQQLCVRRGDWKLVHTGGSPDTGQNELFNVGDDPYEQHNRAAERPEIVNALFPALEEQYARDAPASET
jgi:arylsulfatase A-like enzyme